MESRFTDFLVYEIGLNGEIVRLKDIKGPIPEKKQRKNKNKNDQSGVAGTSATTNTEGDATDSKNENVSFPPSLPLNCMPFL